MMQIIDDRQMTLHQFPMGVVRKNHQVGIKRTLTDISNSRETYENCGKRAKQDKTCAAANLKPNTLTFGELTKSNSNPPNLSNDEGEKIQFDMEDDIFEWDKADWDSNRKEVEALHYCKEIVHSYLANEVDPLFDAEYMDKVQTDIKPRMRTILYCWMVEVHAKFKLKEASLWGAFSLCDRYLARVNVHRKTLQLVGSCCLWIASKYQEIYPPLANDFVYISDNAFSRKQLFKCETAICQAMEYDFARPNAHNYANRFIKAGIFSIQTQRHKERVKWLTYYALERSMLYYQMLKHKPSKMAAGSLCCALALTGHRWNEQLEKLTSYTHEELKPVARCLRKIILQFENGGHQAVITKYADKSRGAVALLRKKTSSSEQAKNQAKMQQISRVSQIAAL